MSGAPLTARSTSDLGARLDDGHGESAPIEFVRRAQTRKSSTEHANAPI